MAAENSNTLILAKIKNVYQQLKEHLNISNPAKFQPFRSRPVGKMLGGFLFFNSKSPNFSEVKIHMSATTCQHWRTLFESLPSPLD